MPLHLETSGGVFLNGSDLMSFNVIFPISPIHSLAYQYLKSEATNYTT